VERNGKKSGKIDPIFFLFRSTSYPW